MSDSNAEKNKAIVLEAFDTLFNKRAYTAAEQFWSPNYIQHSAHIEPERDGLFNLVKAGKVTEKEALSKSGSPQGLEMNFKGIFLDEGRRIIS